MPLPSHGLLDSLADHGDMHSQTRSEWLMVESGEGGSLPHTSWQAQGWGNLASCTLLHLHTEVAQIPNTGCVENLCCFIYMHYISKTGTF